MPFIQEDDYALGKLDIDDVAHDDGQAAHQPQSISDNTVDCDNDELSVHDDAFDRLLVSCCACIPRQSNILTLLARTT